MHRPIILAGVAVAGLWLWTRRQKSPSSSSSSQSLMGKGKLVGAFRADLESALTEPRIRRGIVPPIDVRAGSELGMMEGAPSNSVGRGGLLGSVSAAPGYAAQALQKRLAATQDARDAADLAAERARMELEREKTAAEQRKLERTKTGAAAGAAAGAAVGSILPIVGTAIGSTLGSGVGALVGRFS